MEIKNVIICGLGALGLTYASKLKNVCSLKILADEKRIEKYKKNIPEFNGEKLQLDYITPNEKFHTDLIIIAVKSNGLDSAIKYIKNFISENTIIISLVNGISSEEKIASVYGKDKILYSYFIGHSAMRDEVSVKQDGIGKIVFSGKKADILENFFKKAKIDYEIPNDIIYSLWLKFGVNIILNQLSAIYEMTVGELKQKPDYLPLAENLLNEVYEIASAHGVNVSENYKKEVLKSIDLIAPDGKTSMLQDIFAKRKTEVDIFSGEIIKLGKKYNIPTPYNQEIYTKIKQKEESFL